MDYEKRFRVPARGFSLAKRATDDKAGTNKAASEKQREQDLERLDVLQERLYAEGRRSLLVVFQAMDAAGKDGTIEHVMSGLNPAGVQVTSFKQPTSAELAHGWLWRHIVALPPRGQIGIFNRSHYEEVVAVRVHPQWLEAQAIDPARGEDGAFWKERFEDIRTWERYLHRSGTRVVKFFLHVSRDEQRRRFLDRVAEPEKNWKFSPGDVEEREHWDAYQHAFDAALGATSTKESPWYVIPADRKWFMRTAVASILVHHLQDMDPQFPEPTAEDRAMMEAAVKALQAE
jgi:PPK2 family polyphosphate:nucleotide phosphotransferase